MAPRALVEDQPFFAALWLSSASYISHTAEYRMLLLGLSLGSISIWPYFICPLPWCPTFSYKCARISLVVWWFFGTIVRCLDALAKVDSHGLPPTFSVPSLSVKALIYDNSADLHLSSSAQCHQIIFVNMLLWSQYYEAPSFPRSCTIVWPLDLSANHGLCSANNSNHKLLNINKWIKWITCWIKMN